MNTRKRLRFAWQAGLQELRNRFRSSLLGGSWLLLGPLLLMTVYWFVFDQILDVRFKQPNSSATVPFLLAFAVGFFNYLTLTEFMSQGAGWFKGHRRLILESDLPVWSVYAILIFRNAVQYAFYLTAVLLIGLFYSAISPWGAMVYLLVALLTFIFSAGVGLVTAFFGAFFGDIREFIPVISRILFYASTITFPLALVPQPYRWIPELNPLAWSVRLSRSALLWEQHQIGQTLLVVVIGTIVAWALGAFLYRRLSGILEAVV